MDAIAAAAVLLQATAGTNAISIAALKSVIDSRKAVADMVSQLALSGRGQLVNTLA
jgi:hypothetical protein